LIIDTVPGTLEMDFDELLRAKEIYGKKLVGAVVIHPLGKSLDLSKIETLKKDHNFFILEDNCESIGSGTDGRYAGTVGDFGSYSFYYSHHMTTVEGGMITTNDEKYANDLLSMRAHGWTRNRMDKSQIEDLFPILPKEFLFVTPGYNFRPMEFQGALGSSQLKRLDSFIAKRTENALKIHDSLKGTTLTLIGSSTFGCSTLERNSSGPVSHSWMALPILSSNKDKDIQSIKADLEKYGIATRPLLAGDFTAQPAGAYPGIEKFGTLENSKEIYSNSFMIGNHHNYSESQVEYLAAKLLEVQ
jgi:CDP-6-deoxy-D-xylo-4-hexulose-3-dehydrase